MSTSDFDQFQAYLILAAGFEVTEMPEMPGSKIMSEMHSAYLRQAGNKTFVMILVNLAFNSPKRLHNDEPSWRSSLSSEISSNFFDLLMTSE